MCVYGLWGPNEVWMPIFMQWPAVCVSPRTILSVLNFDVGSVVFRVWSFFWPVPLSFSHRILKYSIQIVCCSSCFENHKQISLSNIFTTQWLCIFWLTFHFVCVAGVFFAFHFGFVFVRSLLVNQNLFLFRGNCKLDERQENRRFTIEFQIYTARYFCAVLFSSAYFHIAADYFSRLLFTRRHLLILIFCSLSLCGLSHKTSTYYIFHACILISLSCAAAVSVAEFSWDSQRTQCECVLDWTGFPLCCRVVDFIFNNVKQTFRSAFGFCRHLCLFAFVLLKSNFIFSPFSLSLSLLSYAI